MMQKHPIVAVLAGLAASAAGALAQCDSVKSAGDCTRDAQATAMLATYSHEAGDIVDVAVGAGMFKTLAAALGAAELVDALKSEGPFTVFAPTDEAFAKLPKGTVESLLKPENKAKLQQVLLYHVVEGKVESKDVVKLKNATTLAGQRVDVSVNGKTVEIDDAKVVKADVMASNGVIHVIDTVMLPEQMDIIGVATEAGSFKTLAAALQAAGLVETLQGEGPFTVFAPTDDAFAKLPAGTVESLLKPENREKLRSVLLYHVVPGRVYADNVVALIEKAHGSAEVSTAQGSTVAVKLVSGKPTVDGASIVKTDIEASNGVIHVIDAVILPD